MKWCKGGLHSFSFRARLCCTTRHRRESVLRLYITLFVVIFLCDLNFRKDIWYSARTAPKKKFEIWGSSEYWYVTSWPINFSEFASAYMYLDLVFCLLCSALVVRWFIVNLKGLLFELENIVAESENIVTELENIISV